MKLGEENGTTSRREQHIMVVGERIVVATQWLLSYKTFSIKKQLVHKKFTNKLVHPTYQRSQQHT